MPAADAFVSSVCLCEWHWQKAVRDFSLATETLRAHEFERGHKVSFIPADAERLRWSCPNCGERDTLWVDVTGATARCAMCSFERDEREHRWQMEQAHLSRAAGKSVVYYIRFGSYVKIGISGNLGRRLSELPWDELCAIEFGDRRLEVKRHRQFAKSRHWGEWFRITPNLVDHVEELGSSGSFEAAA